MDGKLPDGGIEWKTESIKQIVVIRMSVTLNRKQIFSYASLLSAELFGFQGRCYIDYFTGAIEVQVISLIHFEYCRR